MSDKNPYIDDPFIVKESALISFLFSFLFFAMFIGALATIGFDPNYPLDLYRGILYGTIFPANLFLVKGIKTNIIIEINDTGIWYKGNLVTS